MSLEHVSITSGRRIARLHAHPRHELVAAEITGATAVEVGGVTIEDVVAAAWHPRDPLLAVAGTTGLRLWSPATGIDTLAGTPYDSVGFSPDGRAVCASGTAPTDDLTGDDDLTSDVFDLETGERRTARWWDTGLSHHPGGNLALAWSSDQGATTGLFLRAGMEVSNRALIVDVDGYQAPVFSPDGGCFAFRGNAYEHTLHIVEFPSLRLLLLTSLGTYDDEPAWSPHNLVFSGARTLLVGTPAGNVLEIDVETPDAVSHPVLDDDPVTALAVTPAGDILVAGASGNLAVVRGSGGPAGIAEQAAAEQAATAFLRTTHALPDDADLENEIHDDLVLTDGVDTWTGADLGTITETAPDDPAWLQIRAAANAATKPEPDA